MIPLKNSKTVKHWPQQSTSRAGQAGGGSFEELYDRITPHVPSFRQIQSLGKMQSLEKEYEKIMERTKGKEKM